MILSEILTILDGQVFTPETYDPNREVNFAYAGDLMSDILLLLSKASYDQCQDGMMVTGLVTNQTIKTAQLLDLEVILFVRDKVPSQTIIDLASDNDIILLGTPYLMFGTNGRLYNAGLKGYQNVITY